MPQEDDDGGQMQEALEVVGMVFVAYHQTAVSAQRPAILHGHPPVAPVGRDHPGAVVRLQPLIQPVAVVALSPINPSGTPATRRSSRMAPASFTSAGEAPSARRTAADRPHRRCP
jgi:hypothetical protein